MPKAKVVIEPGNVLFLRKRIRDLEREAAGLRTSMGERDEFKGEVAAALAAEEPYPPFRYAPRVGGKHKPIVPVLDLSDLHIGEVINPDEVEGFNAFNWEIAQAGMFCLLEDFLQWVEIQRGHYLIEECAVFCKGDYVSGDIHAELRATNEWPLPVQTAKAGWLLGEAFRILSGHFKRVTAFQVGADNHGRLQPKPQAKQKTSNSMSYLVQHIANAAAERCANFRPVVAAGSKLVAEVNGKRFLLEHGDNIKAWSGIPLYGIQRAAAREAMRRMDGGRGYDYYSIGHFHVPNWLEGRILVNGSLSGTSEFDHGCGRHALPAQVAYLVHPVYGIFNFTPFVRRDVKRALAPSRATGGPGASGSVSPACDTSAARGASRGPVSSSVDLDALRERTMREEAAASARLAGADAKAAVISASIEVHGGSEWSSRFLARRCPRCDEVFAPRSSQPLEACDSCALRSCARCGARVQTRGAKFCSRSCGAAARRAISPDGRLRGPAA